jgi:hypothetical protein
MKTLKNIKNDLNQAQIIVALTFSIIVLTTFVYNLINYGFTNF